VWQPPGFQLVLRAAVHEAAVVAASIASRSGLVALGDASGDLSVLNLSKVRGSASVFFRNLSEGHCTRVGPDWDTQRPAVAAAAGILQSSSCLSGELPFAHATDCASSREHPLTS
jgi:hypothetical protein